MNNSYNTETLMENVRMYLYNRKPYWEIAKEIEAPLDEVKKAVVKIARAKEEEIDRVTTLHYAGFAISEIANILGFRESEVKRYEIRNWKIDKALR